jgi:hypothetical protein
MEIKSEKEMSNWFKDNYYLFGFKRIIKENKNSFPDFIMEDKDGEVRVELEIKSSCFLLHKHNKELVDVVFCIDKDKDIGVPVIEIEDLNFDKKIVTLQISELTRRRLNKSKYNHGYKTIDETINKSMDAQDWIDASKLTPEDKAELNLSKCAKKQK